MESALTDLAYSASDVIRTDFMSKRSQGRSRFALANYKHRWFILTRTDLTYYDGTPQSGHQKLKGTLPLKKVIAVEEVCPEASQNQAKPDMFQVSYMDDGNKNVYTLYIQAQNEAMRHEWIQTLRRECQSVGAKISLKYHPGMWIRRLGHFTCCKQISRFTLGCRPSFLIRSSDPIPLLTLPPEDEFSRSLTLEDSPPSSAESRKSSTQEPPRRNTSVATIYESDDDLDGEEFGRSDTCQSQDNNDNGARVCSSAPRRLSSPMSTSVGSNRSDLTEHFEFDYHYATSDLKPDQKFRSRMPSLTCSTGSDSGSELAGQVKAHYGSPGDYTSSVNDQWSTSCRKSSVTPSTASDTDLAYPSDDLWIRQRRKESSSYGSYLGDSMPFRVQAKFDYSPGQEGELELIRGEEYEILDTSKYKFWWEARDKYGTVGLIPTDYVDQVTSHGLEKYAWYYGNMSCREAQALLMKEKIEGCFLIRNATKRGIDFSLSVCCIEGDTPCVRHYHIRQNEDNEYYFNERHAFSTVPELVEYHGYNSAGIVTRLRSTPNQPYGIEHELSERWEIDAEQLTLQEELGRGEFGSVYAALWKASTGEDVESVKVAVKILKAGTMTEDKFIQEAEIMTKINSPNLVQIYGLCVTKRPIYIVTEFMKYGSLQSYLVKNKKRLMQRRAFMLDICLQVCKGMAYLESGGFIHRDLAARNCLVGEQFVVKVADFGLTRFVLDDEYTSSTGAKFPIRWASPEVINFCRFSSKSDVWAFGILMWEVFAYGDMPYGDLTNAQVCDMLVLRDGRLGPPANCDHHIYQVMNTCWQQEPELRPTFISLQSSIETAKHCEITGQRHRSNIGLGSPQRRTLTQDMFPEGLRRHTLAQDRGGEPGVGRRAISQESQADSTHPITQVHELFPVPNQRHTMTQDMFSASSRWQRVRENVLSGTIHRHATLRDIPTVNETPRPDSQAYETT